MNTNRVKRTLCLGRWPVVFPIVCVLTTLSAWLATQWLPAREQAMYAIVPGICVFFTTGFLLRQATANTELRGVGMMMLGLAIVVMAIGGIGLSSRLTSPENGERILGFAFYESAAGLVLMAGYCLIVGLKSMRIRPTTRAINE